MSDSKTYFRVYSGDRTGGDANNPVFNLTQSIEGVTGFQIKQVMFEKGSITSKTIKINCRELSSLTKDNIRGTYSGASQTIHEINMLNNDLFNFGDSPKFNCQKTNLYNLSFELRDGDGVSAVTGLNNDETWSLLICFYH